MRECSIFTAFARAVREAITFVIVSGVFWRM